MHQNQAASEAPAEFEPIIAVFDTRTVALRAVDALARAEQGDIWLAVVRGENDDGETIVAHASDEAIVLNQVLAELGSSDEHARRFDGILPPGTAVMSLRVNAKFDDAIRVIELAGGHVDLF